MALTWGERKSDQVGMPVLRQGAERAPAAKGRILICDDDRFFRQLCADILAADGFGTVSAQDGREALEILVREPAGTFQLVLTDLVMPRMNGLQLGRELRRRQPGIRLIVISGSSGVVDVDAIRDAGFAFLPKPVTFAEFQATLEHELGLALEGS